MSAGDPASAAPAPGAGPASDAAPRTEPVPQTDPVLAFGLLTAPHEPRYEWSAPPVSAPRPLAAIALWLAIAGLGVSFFVGWGFPLGIGAIVVAGLALARPAESRGQAAWAIGLGVASLVYSVGWLLWALPRL